MGYIFEEKKKNLLISIGKNLEHVLPLSFSFKKNFFHMNFVIIIFLLYFIIYVKVYQNDIAIGLSKIFIVENTFCYSRITTRC